MMTTEITVKSFSCILAATLLYGAGFAAPSAGRAVDLPQAFQRFDLDGDGVLSGAELETARHSVAGHRKTVSSNAPVPRSKSEQRRVQKNAELLATKEAKSLVSEGTDTRRSVAMRKSQTEDNPRVDSAVKPKPSERRSNKQAAANKQSVSSQRRAVANSAQSDSRRSNAARPNTNKAAARSKSALSKSAPSKSAPSKSAPSKSAPSKSAPSKSNDAKRSTALRVQHAREAAEAAQAEIAAQVASRHADRLSAVRNQVSEQREAAAENLTIRRTVQGQRQKKITSKEAWTSISKNKSKPPAKLVGKFSLGSRSGVKHGKKRGSKYFSAQMKKASRGQGQGQGQGKGKGKKGKKGKKNNN
ncbi:MAG: hypothetical protein ACI8X5_000865 [Planctomycetota bacterium]|jgi:hypothetical protein